MVIFFIDILYLKKYEKGNEYLHMIGLILFLGILFYWSVIEAYTKPIRSILLWTLPLFLFFQIQLNKNKNYPFIVILGCGLLEGNRISPLLMQRCEIAIRLYHAEPRKIVVSGGKGKDESISEALAMKNYLMKQGFDEHEIIIEDQSSNTLENISFTSKLIGNSFTIVTSDYHRSRVFILSKINKLTCNISTSHSIFYFKIYAMAREYFAILSLFPFPLVILYFILFFLGQK